MGQPIILRHTYTRSRDTARAGLRYYQMRPRGPEEPPRAIFGKERTMTRDEAYRLMDEHQAGEHRYLAHRLMLSPPEDQRPEDLRELTRHVMRQLEREKDHTLHWVAVEHRNTEHPHVHIILAGGGERDGRTHEVRLDRDDHARIKEDGLDYCQLELRDRERWERALERAEHQYVLELERGEALPAWAGRREPELDRDEDWLP